MTAGTPPPEFTPREVSEASDRLADAQDWDGLIRLYDTLDEAVTRAPEGEQRSRRALRARVARTAVYELPGDRAAAAARLLEREYTDGVPYPPGLWEVLAHVRAWDEAGPYLRQPVLRHLVAQAAVMRGADLSGEPDLDPAVLGVPPALEPWEAAHWDPYDDPVCYGRHSTASGFDGPGTDGSVRIPPPGRGSTQPLTWAAAPLPTLPGTRYSCFVSVTEPLRTTALQALCRHVAALPREERPRHADRLAFSAAYPNLVKTLGGTGPHRSGPSEALGRTAVWRMLRAAAGLPEQAPVTAVSEFATGLTCLTWEQPSDEVWYLHLAVEHPGLGLCWLVDGQDFA